MPGCTRVLHQVMARGLTGQALFGDNQDREEWVYGLCALARTQALRVYGWVVKPKHFHLLVCTGHKALAVFLSPPLAHGSE